MKHNLPTQLPCPFCDGMAPLKKSTYTHLSERQNRRLTHYFYRCENCKKEFSTTESDQQTLISDLDNAATTHCVICFTPTGGGGGHVHKDGFKVLAKVCKDHMGTYNEELKKWENETIPEAPHPDCEGCYGDWKPEMGLASPAMGLGYIDADGFHELNEDDL